MFSLSIMLGSGQWRLLFKTEEKAIGALNFISEPTPEDFVGRRRLEDDFGQIVICGEKTVLACLLEDLNQSKLAAVELTLHDARIRAKATQAAQTDPAMREASRAPGPSVLTPMGAGPRFQA